MSHDAPQTGQRPSQTGQPSRPPPLAPRLAQPQDVRQRAPTIAPMTLAPAQADSYDDLVTEWLDHLDVTAPTRIRYRRSLLDWVEWCAAQGLDPFGPDIAAAIADWEADVAPRLAKNTIHRRTCNIRAFHNFVTNPEKRDHALARRRPDPSRLDPRKEADAYMRAIGAAHSLHSELGLPPDVPVQINIGADACWGELHDIRIQVNIAGNLTAAAGFES